MILPNRPVTSREYKLMLDVNRFKERSEGTGAFFRLLKFLLAKEGAVLLKEQNKTDERRLTSYLDTPAMDLSRSNYSLRVRDESQSGDGFNIDLKYRSVDRYLSASRDVSSGIDGEMKFEEDIVPAFASRFSHSNKIPSPAKPVVDTIGDAAAIYPGLAALGIDPSAPVVKTNGFEAAEVVRKLCKFGFGTSPIEIKASLSFWYLPGDEGLWPLVAEFSYDYDVPVKPAETDLEIFPTETVFGANRIFAALQNQASWIDAGGTTKTAFALEGI